MILGKLTDVTFVYLLYPKLRFSNRKDGSGDTSLHDFGPTHFESTCLLFEQLSITFDLAIASRQITTFHKH